ncbi:MAG: heavy-metal-associated domain-containing protein [Candidatus Coproplasma sp.]
MIELKIEVEGMHCGMCESHVNDVVRRVNGVKKVSSSHSKNQTVVVAEDDVNQEAIVQAIKAQGYAVGRVDSKPYIKRGLFGKKK